MILNAFKSEDEDETQLLLQNKPISRVSSFKYLGIHIFNQTVKLRAETEQLIFKLNMIKL